MGLGHSDSNTLKIYWILELLLQIHSNVGLATASLLTLSQSHQVYRVKQQTYWHIAQYFIVCRSSQKAFKYKMVSTMKIICIYNLWLIRTLKHSACWRVLKDLWKVITITHIYYLSQLLSLVYPKHHVSSIFLKINFVITIVWLLLK